MEIRCYPFTSRKQPPFVFADGSDSIVFVESSVICDIFVKYGLKQIKGFKPFVHVQEDPSNKDVSAIYYIVSILLKCMIDL